MATCVSRKNLLCAVCIGAFGLIVGCNNVSGSAASRERLPNILLITADDLNCDSPGATGGGAPNITPNLDRFASEGIRFEHAHIMTPICGPSRTAMNTGRYPHCSGGMGNSGFPPKSWTPPPIKTPTLAAYLQRHGYLTAAIMKREQMVQQAQQNFDIVYGESPYGIGQEDRDPETTFRRTVECLNQAKKQKRPIFIYHNIIDPHTPWPGTPFEKETIAKYMQKEGAEKSKEYGFGQYPPPSRIYKPDEIVIPSVLPDIPEIRQYMTPYFDAVKRMDDHLGQILRALRESGMETNTIVVFLSDHGMEVPGGKLTLYNSGTRTPLMIRWPRHITAGRIESQWIVSAVDLMPTLIEVIGLPPVDGLDGTSFYAALMGDPPTDQKGYVYTAFNYRNDDSQGQYLPSRGIVSDRYLYIWNRYRMPDCAGGNQLGSHVIDDILSIYRQAGRHDQHLKLRAEYFENRPVEEFFDIQKDPGCWDNLIGKDALADTVATFKKHLLDEMERTKDPELENYEYFIQK